MMRPRIARRAVGARAASALEDTQNPESLQEDDDKHNSDNLVSMASEALEKHLMDTRSVDFLHRICGNYQFSEAQICLFQELTQSMNKCSKVYLYMALVNIAAIPLEWLASGAINSLTNNIAQTFHTLTTAILIAMGAQNFKLVIERGRSRENAMPYLLQSLQRTSMVLMQLNSMTYALTVVTIMEATLKWPQIGIFASVGIAGFTLLRLGAFMYLLRKHGVGSGGLMGLIASVQKNTSAHPWYDKWALVITGSQLLHYNYLESAVLIQKLKQRATMDPVARSINDPAAKGESAARNSVDDLLQESTDEDEGGTRRASRASRASSDGRSDASMTGSSDGSGDGAGDGASVDSSTDDALATADEVALEHAEAVEGVDEKESSKKKGAGEKGRERSDKASGSESEGDSPSERRRRRNGVSSSRGLSDGDAAAPAERAQASERTAEARRQVVQQAERIWAGSSTDGDSDSGGWGRGQNGFGERRWASFSAIRDSLRQRMRRLRGRQERVEEIKTQTATVDFGEDAPSGGQRSRGQRTASDKRAEEQPASESARKVQRDADAALHSGEYEFNPAEEVTLRIMHDCLRNAGFANTCNCIAIALLGTAQLATASFIPAVGTSMGIVDHSATALLFYLSARHFEAVLSTLGSDITRLLKGLGRKEGLGRLFDRLAALGSGLVTFRCVALAWPFVTPPIMRLLHEACVTAIAATYPVYKFLVAG